MLRLLLIAVLTFAGLLFWNARPQCETEWRGVVGPEFATKAKQDLQAAHGCEVLHISLYSPGGEVFDTLDILRDMDQSKLSGLKLEIRAKNMVASAATLILAAGSPGFRHVEPDTIVVVHGIRVGWGKCQGYTEEPITEDEKVYNSVIRLVSLKYAQYSGKRVRDTFEWLKCDNSQVGDGKLLVTLGLADTYGGSN
jgi:ATP-dependent protease ClpP protease subunit